jgi:hypothetical protein
MNFDPEAVRADEERRRKMKIKRDGVDRARNDLRLKAGAEWRARDRAEEAQRKREDELIAHAQERVADARANERVANALPVGHNNRAAVASAARNHRKQAEAVHGILERMVDLARDERYDNPSAYAEARKTLDEFRARESRQQK